MEQPADSEPALKDQREEAEDRGQVRHGEPLEEENERPSKRQRAEWLEAMFTQLEQTALTRRRKETNYKSMEKANQKTSTRRS